MKNVILLTAFLPLTALAQSPSYHSSFLGQFIFWLGAAAVMFLMSRVLFKEQFHERRTLRRLIDEIGPFHREFDMDAITRWVHQCNPHVWHLYRNADFSAIDDFVTDEFKLSFRDEGPKRISKNGEQLRFEKVLKVHPLGIYMIADHKPPAGIELMLRVEEKVEIVPSIRPAQGSSPKYTQVQTFWIMRHDGQGWRLHRVWEATQDVTNLAQKTPVPPVTEWMPSSS